MRIDAVRNAEKLRVAAADLFQERGLQVPLKDIARRAGLSHGTLYNLFGTREALIDEVMTDHAARHLQEIAQQAWSREDAWEGFAQYVEAICELQVAEPAIADVVSGRYPDATRLMAVCARTMEDAQRILARAREAGALRPDFTNADLVFAFAANAVLARATVEQAPDAWRRQIVFFLDGLKTAAASQTLSAQQPTEEDVRGALRALSEQIRAR